MILEMQNGKSQSAMVLMSVLLAQSGMGLGSVLNGAIPQHNNYYWPFQSFKTVDFYPPVLQIDRHVDQLGKGYIFYAPGTANASAPVQPRQTSPMIIESSGELIWSAENGTFANNFKIQHYNGKPVLTYWSGVELGGEYIGHYYGAIHILDDSYQEIHKICPKLDLTVPASIHQECLLDGHESELTGHNTVLFTAYNITIADLSPIGGPKEGSVWDCLFYEYDLKTRKIIFQWSALDHVPINDTKNPLGPAGVNSSNPFDYFHINSVQRIGDKYLVNARHTWSTYMVKPSGGIEWTIQGETGGDFTGLSKAGHFAWQHDARGHYSANDTTFHLRYFNNYNAFQDNGTAPSNGLKLLLNIPKRTVKFLQAVEDAQSPIYSVAQGSTQVLGNGNFLLCYGLEPTIREFGPKGNLLYSARFGVDNEIQTYRAFRQQWSATPKTKPAVVVEKCTGYVSWNGATDVTRYVIFEETGGSSSTSKTVPKKGFETMFTIGKTVKSIKVAAYNGQKFLRNSTSIAVKGC